MASFERQCIEAEVVQRREEGCDVAALESRVEEALQDESADDAVFVELYDALDALEPSLPYTEPSDLKGIRALRPDGPRRMELNASDDEVRDRILGAWLGRAAGGASSENRSKAGCGRVSTTTSNPSVRCRWTTTFPTPKARCARVGKPAPWGTSTAWPGMTTWTTPILGLLALEQHGADLTSRDMANIVA